MLRNKVNLTCNSLMDVSVRTFVLDHSAAFPHVPVRVLHSGFILLLLWQHMSANADVISVL